MDRNPLGAAVRSVGGPLTPDRAFGSLFGAAALAAMLAAAGLPAGCRHGDRAATPGAAVPAPTEPDVGEVNILVRRDRSALRWEQAGLEAEPPPVVRVALNGRTVLALVDTGASLTLIDAEGARRVGIRPWRGTAARVGAQGLGARSTAEVAIVRDMRIGGLWMSNAVVAVAAPGAELGPAGWIRGRRVEMAIGTDILRAAGRMLWDGPGFRVVLAPTDAEANLPIRVPLDLRSGLPVVAEGRAGAAVLPLAFDTGGEFGLWVPGPLSRAVGLPFPPFDAKPAPSYGFGGRVIALPAGEMDVGIGPRRWPRVPLLIGATGQGHAHLPFGLVGRRVFGRERVVFDFTGRQLRMSP